MNSIIDFFKKLFILLDAENIYTIEDFAIKLKEINFNEAEIHSKEEYYLNLAVDFLEELKETPFYKDNYIALTFDYNNKDLLLLKDEELKSKDEKDQKDFYDELDDDIIEITFSEIRNDLENYKHICIECDLKKNDLEKLKQLFLGLDFNEELEVYKALNNINLEKLDGEIKKSFKKIKELLKEKYDEEFHAVNRIEVIKIPNINIEKNLKQILDLYDLIIEGNILDIQNKNGNITGTGKLKRVYYDLDAHTWKVEFLKKGARENIRLDYIGKIEKSNIQSIRNEKKRIHNKEIKFRVFHEENAKEKALRYAVKYNMNLDIKEEYTDIAINISDDEKFLRWVRTMTPSVVILEPLSLREKMIKEIKEWVSVYN